jgi:hypothetical protein
VQDCLWGSDKFANRKARRSYVAFWVGYAGGSRFCPVEVSCVLSGLGQRHANARGSCSAALLVPCSRLQLAFTHWTKTIGWPSPDAGPCRPASDLSQCGAAATAGGGGASQPIHHSREGAASGGARCDLAGQHSALLSSKHTGSKSPSSACTTAAGHDRGRGGGCGSEGSSQATAGAPA